MRKIFVLITIGFLSAGCSANNQNQNPGNNQQAVNPPPASTTQIYRNQTYGFSFDYGDDFAFVTPTYANLEDKIAQLNLPQSEYPKTNFGDAGFAVSATFAATLDKCLTTDPGNSSGSFRETKTINGITFYTSNGDGVGLGNLYTSKYLRTWRAKLCFEISETIHTSEVANYPPGTVTEVDKNPIWQKLDNILNSFKFTS